MTAPDTNDRAVVLVADDDPDILTLVAFRLEQAGYEVLTAPDGEEAIRLALDRRPDLVVLDVRMPKLNGFEVTARLRGNENTSKMPIVLLSASVREASIAKGFEAGADDYLKKPFSPQELLARIEAVLGRR